MALHDIKSLAELAPSLERVEEQKLKSEEVSPSRTYSDPGASTRKPQLEDFVFFASAQRSAERKEDGTT
jgi:hypothetical protein